MGKLQAQLNKKILKQIVKLENIFRKRCNKFLAIGKKEKEIKVHII